VWPTGLAILPFVAVNAPSEAEFSRMQPHMQRLFYSTLAATPSCRATTNATSLPAVLLIFEELRHKKECSYAAGVARGFGTCQ
jgi:hypothetical protein